MTLSLVFYTLAVIITLAACINAACYLYKDINNTTINTSNKILAIIGDIFVIIASIAFDILMIFKIIGIFS